MKAWAVANQKGGVGKTTSAVNLAGMLSRQGKRVLLLDLDPHGSMTAYFGHDPDSVEESVYTLFQRAADSQHTPLASMLKRTSAPGVTLLPAATSMVTLDRQLAGRDGMGLVIANTLQQYVRQFDYALMDCPPVMGVLMVNALAACQQLVIPVQTEFLALKGLERMMHTLAMIAKAGRANPPHLVVPTMFDKRTRASHDALHELQRRYPDRLWRSVIPIDTRFREASQRGTPLTILAPGSRGSRAYQKLLETLDDDDQEGSPVAPEHYAESA